MLWSFGNTSLLTHFYTFIQFPCLQWLPIQLRQWNSVFQFQPLCYCHCIASNIKFYYQVFGFSSLLLYLNCSVLPKKIMYLQIYCLYKFIVSSSTTSSSNSKSPPFFYFHSTLTIHLKNNFKSSLFSFHFLPNFYF